MSMTLSDLQGHSRIVNLFKWDFAHSCAVVDILKFDKISTDSASRGPSAIAEPHHK